LVRSFSAYASVFGDEKGSDLSSLGMDRNGDVRSASEFKEIFEETGNSYGPYKCPFCEVPFEDRCIVTECVKAPHFKLPNGTAHRNGCNGEAGGGVTAGANAPSEASKRTVVGKIEIPEALVRRRKASSVRNPGDDGLGAPPDAIEIVRRRRLIDSDKTISSRFTTSQLRPIVHAYKRLRKHAYEQAVAAGLERGSAAYNARFREILDAHDLSLYKQKLTYGSAFQGSRLSPWHVERVYNGSGKVLAENDCLVIKDMNTWPRQLKSRDLIPFEIKVSKALASDAPTSLLRALAELEHIAASGGEVEWWAYGVPLLQGQKFELSVDSLDHIYWIGQHQR
jgi:hypothetical protein